MLESGFKVSKKLTLLGAVEKPSKGDHVASSRQHRLFHALQSYIASTWTTGSSRSASKVSFSDRQGRNYGLKTLPVV
jgi:hypothetical protein